MLRYIDILNGYRQACVCVCVCAIMSLLMCGCDPVNGNMQAASYTEQIIYQGLMPIKGRVLDSIAPEANNESEVDYQEGTVYLSSWEVRNVLISNAAVVADYSPWRLPTRKEAGVLKGLDSIAGVGDLRYICVDEDGSYYTFKFGGGAVTKAGAKTKYNIRPIRVEYVNPNIIVYL